MADATGTGFMKIGAESRDWGNFRFTEVVDGAQDEGKKGCHARCLGQIGDISCLDLMAWIGFLRM